MQEVSKDNCEVSSDNNKMIRNNQSPNDIADKVNNSEEFDNQKDRSDNQDDNVSKTFDNDEENNGMEPVGPWASGRMLWNPSRKFTGIWPVVDRYSITRYSENDWSRHNSEILNRSSDHQIKGRKIDFNSCICVNETANHTDVNQQTNTKRLEHRARDIYYWKSELECAISNMADELRLLESQKQRVKRALGVLKIPESIAGECLDRRTARLEPDLVRDALEEEIMKEVALVKEVNTLLNNMLTQIEEQLQVNESIKRHLEMDWGDKKDTYDIETTVIGLKNTSPAITFKPGSARLKDAQSSPDTWFPVAPTNIKNLEMKRERSKALRIYVDNALTDASRDLREQADCVDAALAHRIAETHEARQKLENDLQKIVRQIADTEKMISTLKHAIRAKDTPMKVVQTRLGHRLIRPGVENCRDTPQYGLLDEVKVISESVAALQTNLKQNEEILAELLDTKAELECAVMIKRKTLSIDQGRCQEIRSYYPSTVTLTGY